MNWKTIGKGFKVVSSMIIVPCSWYIIIATFGEVLGEIAGILSAIGLLVFTFVHFMFNYSLED